MPLLHISGVRWDGRRRLFAVLSILMGILAALGLVEATLRAALLWQYGKSVATHPSPAPSDPDASVELGQLVYRVDNPRLGFRLMPHAEGIFHGEPLKLNALGLRYAELPDRKPAGTIRVVGLGDSTMFGWGVAAGQRYVDWLERGLQNAFGPDRTVQVIPAAIPAWNSVQEVEFLRTEWERLEPDAVLIQFDPNDTGIAYPKLHPRFLTARKIYLLHLRAFMKGTLLKQEVADPAVTPRDGDQRAYAGWEPLRRAYADLASVCRAHGIPLLATLAVRSSVQLDPAEPFADSDRYERFAQMCSDLGIPLVDPNDSALLAAWPDAPWPGEAGLFQANDGHAGKLGQAVIAAAVFPDLLALLRPKGLSDAGSASALAEFQRSIAPALSPGAERGLYGEEVWGNGVKVHWGQRRIVLPISPQNSMLVLKYHIGHPDISATRPVIVDVALDGGPAESIVYTRDGDFARRIALSGRERFVEIRVNRAFRENEIGRALAIALYPLEFEKNPE